MASNGETSKEEESSSSFLSVNGTDVNSITSTIGKDSSFSETISDRGYVQLKKEEEACSNCVKKKKIRTATHFCKDCGQYGKYLCKECLKYHYDFTNGHKVKSLSKEKDR